MTTHFRYEQLTAAAIDFHLTPTEQADVAEHLETCSACRTVDATYRTEAAGLRGLAFADPPPRIRSAVVAAAALPATRAIEPWKLLVAAALLLATFLGAALAIGAWDSRPTLVVTVPVPSRSSNPSAALAPSPSAVEASIEPTPFAPPPAKCPSPTSAVRLPDVTVSVGNAPGVVATRGSSTTVTCTTTGSEDVIPPKPTQRVSAGSGDRLVLTVPAGWAFLHVEGGDGPVTGDGGNVNAPIDTPDLPARVEYPGPVRQGDSIAGLTVWMIRADGRVVGQLEILVRVSVGAASSPSPTGTATLTLPEGAIKTVPSKQAMWSGTAYGSRAFEVVFDSKVQMGGTLVMRDLATGNSASLGTVDAAHMVGRMVASEDRLTWVETWRDKPSPPTTDVPGCVDAGKPLHWKIVSLAISSGIRSTIVGGTNVRSAYEGQCADVASPVIAADALRIAYTLEAASPSHRYADQVVVRSFRSGSSIRSFTTDGMVEDLRLSGGAIAFRENTGDSQGLLIYGTGRLMVARDDESAPAKLEDGVGALALGGTRLAWVRTDSTRGGIWTTVLGTTEVTEIAAPVDAGLQTNWAGNLSVADNLVAWSVNATINGYDAGGCCAVLLSVWAPGEPNARYIEGFGGPDGVAIRSGWLLWHTNRDSLAWHDDGSRPDGFYGVPLEAVASPWP